MPNAPTSQLPKPGERFWFAISGHTFHNIIKHQFTGLVSRRGDQHTVTPDLLEANTDRLGTLAPWIGLLHDPDGQTRRFGQVIVVPGEFPRDRYVTTVRGEPDHEEARRDAVRAAKVLPSEAERKAELRRIEDLYGPAQPTSRTNAVYSDKD